jgi:alkylhydroperoxidase family enzyme
LDVNRYADSEHFSEREVLALKYADDMTMTSEEVSDELFDRLREQYTEEEIVELTCTIAFENFLSKFHRALRVESQGFCPVLRPPAED